jgi:hypothetical protein
MWATFQSYILNSVSCFMMTKSVSSHSGSMPLLNKRTLHLRIWMLTFMLPRFDRLYKLIVIHTLTRRAETAHPAFLIFLLQRPICCAHEALSQQIHAMPYM